MAIGKTAASLILAGAAVLSAAQFPVRHEHIKWFCDGTLTVDENGVSFQGPKKHAWRWKFEDIQEFKLGPEGVTVLTYKDNRWRLGADRVYRFTGKVPAEEIYALLRDRLDQRFIAEIGVPTETPAYTLPVKHLGTIAGSEGILAFGSDLVVYTTPSRGQSRTWRYSDIENISSSGRFQLTLTTLEKGFNFELKQPITEARYNRLWLDIQKKNGRIQ